MADAPTFSRSRLAFALALICFANFLNYLDRQVVSALESEIRPAFGMSKPEFGTLWSAFTIGYMVFAPLVGYAAVGGFSANTPATKSSGPPFSACQTPLQFPATSAPHASASCAIICCRVLRVSCFFSSSSSR